MALRIRPALFAALTTFAATIALSIAFAAIVVFAAASAADLLLGGSSAGSTPGSGQGTGQPAASDIGTVIQALFKFIVYTFFAGHFGPLEASGFGGATYSVIGVGSLTIAAVAFLLPFVIGRRTERAVPMASAGSAFVGGAIVGIPYGLGALALYFLSVATIGPQQLGISIHASLLGVFLAAAVTGLGGGLGGASIRVVRGAVASSAIRGAARATAGIALGAVLTAVIAVAWIGLNAVAQPSGSTSTTLPSPSAAAQLLGWSIAALIPFYFFNAIALIWSATLDGSLSGGSPLHLLIYLGPISGALLGALRLRRNADRVEQASYAGSFALGTGIIGLIATPAIVNGLSLLPNPWTGVLIALLFAVVSALAAPYLLALAPVRSFASGRPLTWVMKPLLGLWPAEVIEGTAPQIASRAEVIDRIPPQRASKAFALPRPRLGWIYAAVAAVLVILLATGIVANAQLTARFSPESAALSYIGAQSRGDADAMWALITFDTATPSTASRLLGKDALKAMLGNSDNRDITNATVASASRQDDANYTITIHLSRAGQSNTTQLHLRKDPSRSNWVVYPSWRVVVVPSVIQIATYEHAGAITIDGIDSAIAAPAGSVVVIPGVHRLELAPTGIFVGETRQVDASADTSQSFAAQLSLSASAALTTVVDALFDHCAQAQQLKPAGCPNAASPRAQNQGRIRWTLLGDPSAGLKLSSGDAVDTIVASGTWQMHVSFDYWWSSGNRRVQHWDEDISGNFVDTLQSIGSSFDITSHTGATSAHMNGTNSVPKPSITAVAQPLPQGGGRQWRVQGKYFTPGEQIWLYIYVPYNAPKYAEVDVPFVSVRPDGTVTASGLGGDGIFVHGTAMIRACDTAKVCATVLITAP